MARPPVKTKQPIPPRLLQQRKQYPGNIFAKYCWECDRPFVDYAALIAHYKNSAKHQFRCIPCAKDFRIAEGLNSHWKFAAAHRETYCTGCDENFDTPEARAMHLIKAHMHQKDPEGQQKRLRPTMGTDSGSAGSSKLVPVAKAEVFPAGLDAAREAEPGSSQHAILAYAYDAEVHPEGFFSISDTDFDTASNLGSVSLAADVVCLLR